MINSIGKHIPETEIHGCFYFLFWATFKSLCPGERAQQHLAIPILGFIPVDDVSSAFEELATLLQNDGFGIISPFIGYFELTLTGRSANGRLRFACLQYLHSNTAHGPGISDI